MLLALWPVIVYPPKDAVDIPEDFIILSYIEHLVLGELTEVILTEDT